MLIQRPLNSFIYFNIFTVKGEKHLGGMAHESGEFFSSDYLVNTLANICFTAIEG